MTRRGGRRGGQPQQQMIRGRGRMAAGRGHMVQGRGQMQGRMAGRGPIQQPEFRIKTLPEHLILFIFNMLDNNGRINAFRAMGWSTKRYVQRRDNLRRQIENKKSVEKEMAEREVWRKNVWKDVLNAGVKTKEGEKGEPQCKATNGEEKKEADAEGAPTKEMAKVTLSEEKEIEPLPYLGGRVDPNTLLARLNTRRLYGRLKYYRREATKQAEFEEAMKEELRAKGMVIPEPNIIDVYERDLKEKFLMDRIYPKNLTVEQLAKKEWNELIEMANYRNTQGKGQLYDPIPTKHELLLFQRCPRAVAVLASYPRSGNSLMRTLYEHTTLRVTGSDMQGGLAKHDLVGEMAVGEGMVQFVKTHYPERLGSPAFRCSRAVLLVRNPFDAIESYFHLMMTGQHTASLSEENRNKAEKVFDEYAVKEAAVWTKFHQYWLAQEIPILLVRYEDLYRQTDKVMERVLQFALEVKLMGTFFTERIDRCIREEQKIETLGSYKPRSAGIGKSLKKYKPEVIERMKKIPGMMNVMQRLGYDFLLKNPGEKWPEMPLLQGYAMEMLSPKVFVEEQPSQPKTIILNNDSSIISRTQDLATPFQQIKRELGIVEDNCDCAECTKRRQLVGAGGAPAPGYSNGEDTKPLKT